MTTLSTITHPILFYEGNSRGDESSIIMNPERKRAQEGDRTRSYPIDKQQQLYVAVIMHMYTTKLPMKPPSQSALDSGSGPPLAKEPLKRLTKVHRLGRSTSLKIH